VCACVVRWRGTGEWVDCLPEQLQSIASAASAAEPTQGLDEQERRPLSEGELADLEALKTIRRNVNDISGYRLWESEDFKTSPCLTRAPHLTNGRATIFPSRIVGIGCDESRRIVALSLRSVSGNMSCHAFCPPGVVGCLSKHSIIYHQGRQFDSSARGSASARKAADSRPCAQ
jgi:hypothetical protein